MTHTGPRPSATARRAVLVAWIAVLGALGWWAKTAADAWLTGNDGIDLGLVQLRLVLNTGVAFSVGEGLPAWVVLTVTGAITAVAAGYAWWAAGSIPLVGLAGLGGVVAGALTNLVDRAPDGAVTDYLHTGWFATFNVPDSLIVGGVALFVLSSFLPAPEPEGS